MLEKICPGPVHNSACVKEAVCIHTKKIYDSCRVKECIQDLRVELTKCSQEILDRATSVRARSVELIWVYIDVEPVTFNKGFFAVTLRFFYRVTVDAFCGTSRPFEITGVTTYEKRAMLFGGEGSVRSFSSVYIPGDADMEQMEKWNHPEATVDVVAPMLLGARLVERGVACDFECCEIPDAVCRCFDDEIVRCLEGKRLFVTIGQFAILRLQRDTQLLIPAYDYCVPQKECGAGGGNGVQPEDPCEIFESVSFPVAEFFPGVTADGK